MTNNSVATGLVTAAFLFCTSATLGHPGGHDHGVSNDPNASRTWTLAAEGWHLHGTFVAATAGKVQLRRANGMLTSLAVDRLVAADQKWLINRLAEIKRLNAAQGVRLVVQNPSTQPADKRTAGDTPETTLLEQFKPFEKTLKHRSNDKYFFVESNGMPDHPMMIGIRAWQQQVPIP